MTAPSAVGHRTRRWQGCVWDSLDKAPEERRFLLKIDIFLCGFACLGWSGAVIVSEDGLTRIEGFFLKSLDQLNISNAFVSGMYAHSSNR